MLPLEIVKHPVISFALPVDNGSKFIFKLERWYNFAKKSENLKTGSCLFVIDQSINGWSWDTITNICRQSLLILFKYVKSAVDSMLVEKSSNSGDSINTIADLDVSIFDIMPSNKVSIREEALAGLGICLVNKSLKQSMKLKFLIFDKSIPFFLQAFT